MRLRNPDLFQKIRQAIEKIPIFDTHEHFPLEKERLRHPKHFGYYWHYVMEDITKAGFASDLLQLVLSDYFAQSKDVVSKFWELWSYCKNTGYGTALRLFFKELFGIDEIDEATLPRMNEAIANRVHAGWYDFVLDKANIKYCIRTVWSFEPHYCEFKRLFPAPIFDHFALIRSKQDLKQIEADVDLDIKNFDTYLTALVKSFQQRVNERMISVKIFLAYNRALDIGDATQTEAERLFEAIISGKFKGAPWNCETKKFEDFIMHRIVELAESLDLPIQIHTGMQNGNFQMIHHGNPLYLQEFLMAHPRAPFDLFHGGYPFLHEYVALCKTFPNVSANLAWLYVLCPSAAKYLLNQLIETVPVNRIHGFGGDYNFVEGAYAHAKIARDAIAHVLTEKIITDELNEEDAYQLAKQILWNSPLEFYQMNRFLND